MSFTIADFQRESNRIEGITHVHPSEVEALETFLKQTRVTTAGLQDYVKVISAYARLLRGTPDVPGVCVGNHIAPPSGPRIVADLTMLLNAANFRSVSAWEVRCRV